MTDWQTYWNAMPATVAGDDLLKQVGKTVNGRPVSGATVDAIVSDILAALRLGPDDVLLDLCCGNGLLTARCAACCREATGLDFSTSLIRVARERSAAPNVTYVLGDVRALPGDVTARPYSKVLMYEALQHITPEDLTGLLARLRNSASLAAPVLLGSIPDRDRIWRFYDTEERRREYTRRLQEGTEAIGHWWTRAEVSEIARRSGYMVDIRPQSPILPTAHYRFDALLTPSHA